MCVVNEMFFFYWLFVFFLGFYIAERKSSTKGNDYTQLLVYRIQTQASKESYLSVNIYCSFFFKSLYTVYMQFSFSDNVFKFNAQNMFVLVNQTLHD